MPATLLVVDDHAAIRTMLADYFTARGFRVVTAVDGREALAAARATPPDLVLLDVMMPHLDGLEVLRHVRRKVDTPVILLTARVEETDKVIGLELGADDYVTKPFSLREVEARVRAVLRRVQRASEPAEVLRAGALVLDRGRHRVTLGGEDVALTPTEFDLLATLMAAPGRVYSRAQLLERLQGDDDLAGSERTVDVHVRNLRAKLEPDPSAPRFVETVFGVGYRLAAD